MEVYKMKLSPLNEQMLRQSYHTYRIGFYLDKSDILDLSEPMSFEEYIKDII
jgi:hypothetical protein